ncbi:MAG: MBOAT family protein, partial [Bacteroidia bacterium]|nr:MBOAT family protein [Bacteroidia bacterium]
LWGGLHGLALAADKAFEHFKSKIAARKSQSKKQKSISSRFIDRLTRLICIFITFHFVCFCWIFFKANSFQDALVIIRQIIFNLNVGAFIQMTKAYLPVFTLMGIGYIIHFTPKWLQHKLEVLVTDMPLIGKIALTFLFIWVAVQVKQADQVMPIYLQF